MSVILVAGSVPAPDLLVTLGNVDGYSEGMEVMEVTMVVAVGKN